MSLRGARDGPGLKVIEFVGELSLNGDLRAVSAALAGEGEVRHARHLVDVAAPAAGCRGE